MAYEKPDVLVIESDADERQKTASLLASQGYGLRCVRTRNEALKFLKDPRYDYVLMDADVFGMPAGEFLAKLEKQMGETEVVLVTADPKAADMARKLNISRCLVKPYTDAELARVLL